MITHYGFGKSVFCVLKTDSRGPNLSRHTDNVTTTSMFTDMKLTTGPLDVRSVLSDGQGHSYDLSPLAMDSRNWEAESSTDSTEKKFYINVCRSLVQMGGQCDFLF